MGKYIMRLDDACERRNIENWDRIESLLDEYGIKPLVGVIPCCHDQAMEKYPEDVNFWERCHAWHDKGWTVAMHGYNHVYTTQNGGINPVNKRSEFAGVPYEIQKEKICQGVLLMKEHGINPQVFFAPSHTFDCNTIRALKTASNIRIISDTVATDAYYADGFTFIPQQSGKVRALPFKITTFCYHPNDMSETSFQQLETFLKRYSGNFIRFPMQKTDRKRSLIDQLLSVLYLSKHFLKRKYGLLIRK